MNSGAAAERFAEKFLQRQGLTLLQKNYHNYFGEIDLIMQDGHALVFIEVRQRSSADYGGAAGSIDRHKQRRLVRTAQYYLARRTRLPPCRFDVVLMDNAEGLNIEWIKNAFDA
ncbi:MAG: YraN family protein [Gallionella sp.]|nr:YraN family protein [Gallionella sp.]